MVDAARAGVSPEQFWGLTWRELAIILEGATWRAEQSEIKMRTQSWLIAVWGRCKRIPKLKDVLKNLVTHKPVDERLKWLQWADDNKLMVRRVENGQKG